MSKQIEAMKLALDALESLQDWPGAFGKCVKAETALREALTEQPEPMPVKTYSGGKAWPVQPWMGRLYEE